LTPGHDPVQKVTLIPRGRARGLTWFIPGEDPALISKQQLFARIVGGLGGRAAEEVVFGQSEITTGAAGDLQQVTQIARQVYFTQKKQIFIFFFFFFFFFFLLHK
jgi:cell division protease FtsH